ncbi:MAG: molybdopterin molybdenumtransferase MoeA [Rhodobacter sp.]|nr:molybdopterin molybdenumtransferase MoeA [Rhodobacter sp.]
MQPPRLKNDCFALPPGVHWTPVDQAHARLRANLHCVTATETIRVTAAEGRFLATDVRAVRASPPAANSAVDGYGFAGPAGDGVQILPLASGRAAAGVPFDGRVGAGQALRILTGASLPPGADTVVLQEDVTAEDGRIAFHGPLKRGANTRAAGEDVVDGAVVLPARTRLRAQELAILAATGVQDVSVHRPLRVGVLSTGNELCEVGKTATASQIYDANRPMLLSLVERWGFGAVDLGHVGDDRDALRARLDAGAGKADVILTSGGASAGDEDHVSALLGETGSVELWRIAIKPGRPLALGIWQGVPVFGLPGNPVAAFVCTLIFAEPAFRVLAGGDWRVPQGFQVPAAFAKTKKPGRREYLRARINPDGAAEAFRSEGSGRISGLAWADGLVELDDGARKIAPGDMVRYIPFTSFGFD